MAGWRFHASHFASRPPHPPTNRAGPSGSSSPTRGARRRASCLPRPSRRTPPRTSPCFPPQPPPPVSHGEAAVVACHALSVSRSRVRPRGLGQKQARLPLTGAPWPLRPRPVLGTGFTSRLEAWVSVRAAPGPPPASRPGAGAAGARVGGDGGAPASETARRVGRLVAEGCGGGRGLGGTQSPGALGSPTTPAGEAPHVLGAGRQEETEPPECWGHRCVFS